MDGSDALPKTGLGEWRKYWTLPLAAALGYSSATLYTYGMGPFFEPLHEAFGWSRSQTAVGITIAGWTGAALSVASGMLVDRFGPRIVALTAAALSIAAFALLSTATGDPANWLLLWGILALANVGLLAPTWTSAIATRFDKARGLAFAVAFCGAGITAFLIPLLSTWLIGAYGWRTAFVGIAAIWAAVVLPSLFFFFRGAQDGVRTSRAEQSAQRQSLPGLSVPEGLRMPVLYALAAVSMIYSGTGMSTVIHFVPILTDRGADALAAAGIASLIGIFTIIGRFSTGVLLDRFPANFVGAAIFFLPVGGALLLLFGGANPMAHIIASICYGFTVGAEIDVIAYLATRHFGLKNYGVLYGIATGAMAFGAGLGPLAAAMVYDTFGDYAPYLIATIALLLVAILILVTLPRPRFAGSAAPEH